MSPTTPSSHNGTIPRVSSLAPPHDRITRAQPLRFANKWIAYLGRPRKALIAAIERDDQSKACEILKNQHKVVWLDCETLNRALWMTAKLGHAQVVQLLVEKGAGVNNSDDSGDAALAIASRYGHEQVVQQLFKIDANLNANVGNVAPQYFRLEKHDMRVPVLVRNDDGGDAATGRTPLWHAAQGGHEQIVRLLLNNGANVNTATNEGSTPLGEAIKRGHGQIVQALIDKGADVNIDTDILSKPLGLAAEGGHVEIVRLLIRNHTLVNVVDAFGNAPLIAAVESDHKRVVQLLLESGANPLVYDAEHEYTASEVAVMRGHRDIAKLLEKSGKEWRKNLKERKH
jgi:ankyrin repeat protein